MSKKQRIYPWLVAVAMGITMAAVVDTYSGVIGVFLTPIAKSMNVKLSVVSIFYTVLVVVMAVVIPFVGKIIQKINLSLELSITVIVTSLSAVIIANSKSLFLFFVMAAVLGICMAFGGLVVQGIVINNWFEKSRNFAFSLSSVIEAIYISVMTPITSVLIQKFGWKNSFLILALLTLILGIPSALIVKLKPDKLGLLPYGAKSKEKITKERNEKIGKSNNSKVSTKSVVLSGAFLITILFTILVQFSGNITQLFPTYGIVTGIGATNGALMASIVSFVGIIVIPLIGWSCDKFGPNHALPFWLIIGILSYIILSFANQLKSVPLSLIGAALVCSAYGLFGSGQEIFAKYMFEEKFDQGFSLVTSISYFAGAFIMPILSKIYEIFGTFLAVFAFCALGAVIMIVLIFVGKKYRMR